MRHFYDVGANTGQTFDLYLLPGEFRSHWVTCFECSPRHLAALCVKAETVRSWFAGITVVPAVVGRALGCDLVYEKTTALSDSVYSEHRKNRDTGVELLVPVVRLSDFIRTQTDPNDELDVKLDAEGSEYEILADLLDDPDLLSRVVSLQVEWHAVGGSANAQETLTKAFSSHGVQIQRWPF